MFAKKRQTPAVKPGSGSKCDQGKSGEKSSDSSPELVAVDRPGFDLGGATGKTTAGSGLGLGSDAAESRSDRSLPGRRRKRG